jgi:hypothetical protein
VAAGAKRVRAGGRKPLLIELRHRPGALCCPHELDELDRYPNSSGPREALAIRSTSS